MTIAPITDCTDSDPRVRLAQLAERAALLVDVEVSLSTATTVVQALPSRGA